MVRADSKRFCENGGQSKGQLRYGGPMDRRPVGSLLVVRMPYGFLLPRARVHSEAKGGGGCRIRAIVHLEDVVLATNQPRFHIARRGLFVDLATTFPHHIREQTASTDQKSEAMNNGFYPGRYTI
jgi:hypothetical protein